MLALLQQHAGTHADRLAHVLPDRDITYRRLWSRIERGSARLQGEWGVRAGDTVAYVGRGHPDAIVLYFALLRIGASLLPLEGIAAAKRAVLIAERQVTLVVHDDGIDLQDVQRADLRRLEDLLAAWCHIDPVIAADDATRAALWLPADDGQWQLASLSALCAELPARPRSTFVDDRIFTADLLRQVVLPALATAQLMQFAACGPALRTGS